MLELESHIAEWRKRLAAALGDDRKTLDELESHLRDEIHALMQKGMPLESAVELATAKLGTPATLAQEFGKNAQPWAPIYVWGAIVLVAVMLYLVVLLRTGALFPDADADRFVLAAHVVCVGVGYILSFGVGGLAVLYCLRRMVRDLSCGQRTFWLKTLRWSAAIALGFTAVGVILGAFWASDHLGRAWGWDAREIGGLFVIVWLAALLALSRNLRWLLCVGMVGNLVVAFAWFVAPFLHAGTIGQGHGYLAILSVVVAVHLLLMAGSFAPVGWIRGKQAG